MTVATPLQNSCTAFPGWRRHAGPQLQQYCAVPGLYELDACRCSRVAVICSLSGSVYGSRPYHISHYMMKNNKLVALFRGRGCAITVRRSSCPETASIGTVHVCSSGAVVSARRVQIGRRVSAMRVVFSDAYSLLPDECARLCKWCCVHLQPHADPLSQHIESTSSAHGGMPRLC